LAKGLSIAEAARKLEIPRSTVREWAASKLFHCNKDGSVSPRGMKELAVLAEEKDDDEDSAGESADLKRLLLKARGEKERAIAELRKIELEHKQGRFVETSEVRSATQSVCEQIRAQLLSLPSRIVRVAEAAIAAGKKTAEIEALISDEVNRILEALHTMRFAGEA
jgi:transposase